MKYVHHGILFKVAHDEQLRIYNKSIENAQKAAAHDLRFVCGVGGLGVGDMFCDFI